MNNWTQPQFEELAMNAEIGAYQPDPGDEREAPFLAPAPANPPLADGHAGAPDDPTGA